MFRIELLRISFIKTSYVLFLRGWKCKYRPCGIGIGNVLEIFGRMDGKLAGEVVGRANNCLIQRSSITYLFGPVQDILLYEPDTSPLSRKCSKISDGAQSRPKEKANPKSRSF